MLGLGVGEIVLIALALLLLFGARRIPLIARGLGESIRNFKKEVGPGREGADEPKRLEDGDDGGG